MKIQTLVDTYISIKTSLGGASLIVLAIAIGSLLLLKKFTEAYKRAHVNKDGNKVHIDAKAFFDLFWQYIIAFVVIIVAPVFVAFLEKGLGTFEDAVVTTQSYSIDMSLEEAMEFYENEYKKGMPNGGKGSSWPIVKQLQNIYTAAAESYYLLVLYLSKYLFYMYSSGRYIYLLLLELALPIAIVLALDDSTRGHFITWCKHLLICYLMIPAFLLSNNFAELFAKNIFGYGSESMMAISALGPVGLTVTLLLKLFLFSFSIKQLYHIL